MKRIGGIILGVVLVVLVGGLGYFMLFKTVKWIIHRNDAAPVEPPQSIEISVSDDDWSKDLIDSSVVDDTSADDISAGDVSDNDNSDVSGSETNENSDKDQGNEASETVDNSPVPEITTNQYHYFDNFDFVFIGDSIFADNDGKYSVPRLVGQYTGARTYNVSRGGMCACIDTAGWLSLQEAVELFIGDYRCDENESYVINRDIERYWKDDHTDRKLVFFLNCCINDYAMSTPLKNEGNPGNYKFALEVSIDRLRNVFPWASFVLIAPHQYSNFEYGSELNAFLLTQEEYAGVMYEVSIGKNCYFTNLKYACDIDTLNLNEYLKDGMHPNDRGCLLIAEGIARDFCNEYGK